MRNALLVSAAWLGVVQAAVGGTRLQDAGYVTAIAGVLGTLTVLGYKLGVWRQRREDAKSDLAAAMETFRAEAAEWFQQVDQRLEAIDHVLTMAAERHTRMLRWQARAERRIERLEALQSTEHLQ